MKAIEIREKMNGWLNQMINMNAAKMNDEQQQAMRAIFDRYLALSDSEIERRGLMTGKEIIRGFATSEEFALFAAGPGK